MARALGFPVRAVFALLIVAPCAPAALAREVILPLTVDHEILARLIADRLGADAGREVVVWSEADSCRVVALGEIVSGVADQRLQLVARGRGRLGFRFLGFCFPMVSWDGYVVIRAVPAVDETFQLRLTQVDQELYDTDWRHLAVKSRLLDLVSARLSDRLANLALDLGPPVEEARALLRASLSPERARPVLAALDGLRPGSPKVDGAGVHVPVVLTLPQRADPLPRSETPPSAEELARWEARLGDWDGFLVFVIKHLATDGTEAQLLDVLLGSRHDLLTALSTGPTAEGDPVRELFTHSWEAVRDVVRHALLESKVTDRTLRFLSFVTAADALVALDAAGPDVDIEISSAGLRRLARALDPGYVGDPLEHSDAPDPALRDLFHFHDPDETAPPAAAPESWWWLAPRPAWAESAPAPELAGLVRRLDRWVPRDQELTEYRDAVGQLLDLVGARTAKIDPVTDDLLPLFGHLVRAVAWQESCWRQFVQQRGRVTFLLSASGDIGMMQVNRRVWRGFFDLRKLEWDVGYNVGAGTEILAQLLTRYGVREMGGDPHRAARATYSAYNGGPGAFMRYRRAQVPRRWRAVDEAFWKKYQAVVAGEALDYVLCTQEWAGAS